MYDYKGTTRTRLSYDRSTNKCLSDDIYLSVRTFLPLCAFTWGLQVGVLCLALRAQRAGARGQVTQRGGQGVRGLHAPLGEEVQGVLGAEGLDWTWET